jgi:hypothetical protein
MIHPSLVLFRNVMNESTGFLSEIGRDRLLKELGADWNDLMCVLVLKRDTFNNRIALFLDNRGRPTLKPELLYDVGNISAFLVRRLNALPLNRVEHFGNILQYWKHRSFNCRR